MESLKNIIRDGGTVGKKLDFVIQELRREVNTIGSKSSDLEVTVSVVEIKDELEKNLYNRIDNYKRQLIENVP